MGSGPSPFARESKPGCVDPAVVRRDGSLGSFIAPACLTDGHADPVVAAFPAVESGGARIAMTGGHLDIMRLGYLVSGGVLEESIRFRPEKINWRFAQMPITIRCQRFGASTRP